MAWRGRGVQLGAQSVDVGADCGQLALKFVQFRLLRGKFLNDGLLRAHGRMGLSVRQPFGSAVNSIQTLFCTASSRRRSFALATAAASDVRRDGSTSGDENPRTDRTSRLVGVYSQYLHKWASGSPIDDRQSTRASQLAA